MSGSATRDWLEQLDQRLSFLAQRLDGLGLKSEQAAVPVADSPPPLREPPPGTPRNDLVGIANQSVRF